jgi:hypothetical protein
MCLTREDLARRGAEPKSRFSSHFLECFYEQYSKKKGVDFLEETTLSSIGQRVFAR